MHRQEMERVLVHPYYSHLRHHIHHHLLLHHLRLPVGGVQGREEELVLLPRTGDLILSTAPTEKTLITYSQR